MLLLMLVLNPFCCRIVFHCMVMLCFTYHTLVNFLAVISNAAMKFVYKFLCGCVFSFFLNTYLRVKLLGVKLLGHTLTLCLTI